ncbi:ASTRA-associated protein 1 [Dichotomopilus funicola]|uniref:ASTRA-associated protein 1 n=1 Tax=Dichotomopilus funicola TaxID=1934379 RepID=A0AAN6V851_9PEZI|nr:ASTRA-associated protein 1 [Dichotomopilus funicola]
MAAENRPAQPKAILRGHKAQVHAAAFVRGNERLLTGDADGFVVAWDLTVMRPRAVWRAHENAILGIAGWRDDRLITHGRDNKLIVWKFTAQEEGQLSTKLPLDASTETRPQPWMLHMLEVNTMNFCSFSYCPATAGSGAIAPGEILVAVPNTLASEAIDIFHVPSQTRQHTVKLGDKNGMVMALSLIRQGSSLTLIAGYENGVAIVAQLGDHGNWAVRYQAKCHNQPILSLDVDPSRAFFLTSSADAIIAKHPLPPSLVSQPQSSAAPPPTPPSSTTPSSHPSSQPKSSPPISLLTAALSNNPQPPTLTPTTTIPTTTTAMMSTPLKTLNTHHAGQQSLHIRSDSRIFATAGWDARIRVYSTATLAEVAVLKWHATGCFAVVFASLAGTGTGTGAEVGGDGVDRDGAGEGGSQSREVAVVPKLVEMTLREKRVRQAREAHWIAAGSKDGKVSLWDVF